MLTHYLGVAIISNPCMVETVVQEKRVPGGYLNRWLVRKIVVETKPSNKVVHDRLRNRMYCHPTVLAQIEKALAP